MRVALLSAGLSLRHTFRDSFAFDVRIGVNRAVEHFPCDWWSVGDWQAITGHAINRLVPLGDPQIYTLDSSIESMDLRSLRIAKPLAGWKATCGHLAPPTRWATWSSTAAVVLAKHLGATSLDVYGVDMTGNIDIGGAVGSANGDRWNRERPAWESVVNWIRLQGVNVAIHTPTGIPAEAA